jgi:hypothetical protein
MSFGEQYCESAWHGWPLVTLWPLPAQVQRTVSPTEMLTVLGSNVKPPPVPTVTSKIVLGSDGTPLTAGWPFWSTMRMGAGAALFAWGMLVCLSPDSALTKNAMANIAASQKIPRTAAFDLFMILLLLLCASVPDFLLMNRG